MKEFNISITKFKHVHQHRKSCMELKFWKFPHKLMQIDRITAIPNGCDLKLANSKFKYLPYLRSIRLLGRAIATILEFKNRTQTP